MRGNDVNYKTLLNEFLTGEGPEYSGFGADHPMTKDLMNSWIIGIASAKFLLDNVSNIKNNRPLQPLVMYDVPFGLAGIPMSGLNMTEQFVGGARVSIIPIGAQTMYIVNNTTDRYSGGYHFATSIDRVSGEVTPMGTIYQRFMWIKP
ncbi:MAG: hypothetical protein JST69_14515 [Bacteroidetes bacterium]|nr:hypothetical protein [Bacteroidota bacterium]